MFHIESEYKAAWQFGGFRVDVLPHKYKLHICIHPDELEQVQDEVLQLLEDSMHRLKILYKTYNIESVSSKRSKLNDNHKRQMHSPIVIYLNNYPDENYMAEVAQLCEKIETVLAKIKSGTKKYRAECDLPLTPHIIFRQAYRNATALIKENYIEALDDKHALQLKKQGQNSIYYQKLSTSPLLAIPHLKVKFMYEMETFVNQLENYRAKLLRKFDKSKNKRKKENDRLMLLEHIHQISQQIKSIKEKVRNYTNQEFADEQTAEKLFAEEIQITTVAVRAIQTKKKNQLVIDHHEDQTNQQIKMLLANLSKHQNILMKKFVSIIYQYYLQGDLTPDIARYLIPTLETLNILLNYSSVENYLNFSQAAQQLQIHTNLMSDKDDYEEILQRIDKIQDELYLKVLQENAELNPLIALKECDPHRFKKMIRKTNHAHLVAQHTYPDYAQAFENALNDLQEKCTLVFGLDKSPMFIRIISDKYINTDLAAEILPGITLLLQKSLAILKDPSLLTFDQFFQVLENLKSVVQSRHNKMDYAQMIESINEFKDHRLLNVICAFIKNHDLRSLQQLQAQHPAEFKDMIIKADKLMLREAALHHSFNIYNFLRAHGAEEQGEVAHKINYKITYPPGHIRMLKIHESQALLSIPDQLNQAMAHKIGLSNRLQALIDAVDAHDSSMTNPSFLSKRLFSKTFARNQLVKSAAQKLLDLINNFPYPQNCQPVGFTVDEMRVLSTHSKTKQSEFEIQLMNLFNECVDQHLIYPASGIDYRIELDGKNNKMTQRIVTANQIILHDKASEKTFEPSHQFLYEASIDPIYMNQDKKNELMLFENRLRQSGGSKLSAVKIC